MKFPGSYRVSDETWQLANGSQCRLPCFSFLKLFAVYFVKQIFYPNTYLFEINFNKILLPFSISYHHLWYQTNYQIKEEDILNNSPTVMFRGTPCTCKLNSAQEDSEMFKRELLKETPEFPFWGVYIFVDLNSRNPKTKRNHMKQYVLKQYLQNCLTAFMKPGFQNWVTLRYFVLSFWLRNYSAAPYQAIVRLCRTQKRLSRISRL